MTTPRTPVATTISVATLGDTAVLATVLASAFFDDPVGAWLAPDAATRRDRLTRFFEVELDSFTLPHGEVMHISGRGGALWLPPGRWQVPPLLVVRMLPRLGRVFGRRTALMLRGLAALERDHPREPHWYLPFIGVEPAEQGAGVGSALLAAGLRRCDETGLPAYLEATTERNISLYRRHGFLPRGELHLPDGPPVWPMRREPRTGSLR